METITPEVDGIRLSTLWESGDLSRTTCFELLKLAEIEPESRRVPGSQRPVAFLTARQEQIMRRMIQRMRDGVTVAQLRRELTAAVSLVRARNGQPDESGTVPDDPAPSEATAEALPLLDRLQAIDVALATGAPLTTADVRSLLLVWPGAAVVQRGKVQARRMGRNHWVIEPAS